MSEQIPLSPPIFEVEEPHIRRILPRHFQIIELALAGHENKTIAEVLGTSRMTVNAVLASPLVKAEMARRRREDKTEEILGLDRERSIGKARQILEQASVAAAEKTKELMSAPDHSIQLRAASSILDRVFGKGGDNQAASVVNISAEHVQLLALAFKESNRETVPAAHSAPANAAQDEHVNVRQGSEAGQENGRCGGTEREEALNEGSESSTVKVL